MVRPGSTTGRGRSSCSMSGTLCSAGKVDPSVSRELLNSCLCLAGNVKGSSGMITGRIEIPNFSEEHEDMNDVDVECRLAFPGPETEPLRNTIRRGKAAKEIRFLLGLYVSQLRSEYSAGVVLPKKGETEGKVKEIPKKVKSIPAVENSDRKKTEKVGKKNDAREKKRPLKKRKSWKSNDLVFYASLFSIVGISSILVIKLAKRL